MGTGTGQGQGLAIDSSQHEACLAFLFTLCILCLSCYMFKWMVSPAICVLLRSIFVTPPPFSIQSIQYLYLYSINRLYRSYKNIYILFSNSNFLRLVAASLTAAAAATLTMSGAFLKRVSIMLSNDARVERHAVLVSCCIG